MSSAIVASISMLASWPARCCEKVCRSRPQLPAMIASPNPSRLFPMMAPVIWAFTTWPCPARSPINAQLTTLERETTAEIAVVVLDSLSGLTPHDAAFRLHRNWGVGKANRDNGIVLLWSPALRQIYVSVGYGLEGVLPDARVGRIE